MEINTENYTEENANAQFINDIEVILNDMDHDILLLMDEIEQITPGLGMKENWKLGDDFVKFWHTIRSCFHRWGHRFTFILAGTNPSAIEQITIAGFVQKNNAAFHNTLRNLTLILKGWGLIDGELIVIDGTKIHAQNSKHNCITQSGLDKKIEYAEAQINAYLMAIAKNEVPADDLTDKLKTYQELKEQYLTQKQELKDEGLEQKSLTDPDSRRMKNNGSLDICYNVQSVVDAKNHFVVDISTTNDINDQNQLYTMAQKASELLEKESSTVLADTGYYNGTEIKKCVDAGMNVFIKKAKANNATKDNEFRKEKFIYNGETDEYTCPAGNRLRFFENTSKNDMKYRKYKCTDCNSCKYKKNCTTSSSGRTIQRWVHEDVLETVYNETLNNNEVYKQRRCIVEHPFGTIKRSLGYNFFLRRRQENVDAEAASMFIAYNFKRLLSMFSTEELVMRFE